MDCFKVLFSAKSLNEQDMHQLVMMEISSFLSAAAIAIHIANARDILQIKSMACCPATNLSHRSNHCQSSRKKRHNEMNFVVFRFVRTCVLVGVLTCSYVCLRVCVDLFTRRFQLLGHSCHDLRTLPRSLHKKIGNT